MSFIDFKNSISEEIKDFGKLKKSEIPKTTMALGEEGGKIYFSEMSIISDYNNQNVSATEEKSEKTGTMISFNPTEKIDLRDKATTMALGEEGGSIYETMHSSFFDLLKNNPNKNASAESPKEQKFNFFRDYVLASIQQWKQKEKDDLCVNAIISDNDNQDISSIVNTYQECTQEIL